MQGKESSISVVIPAYDRESTIAETLDSLLRQTHRDWEAIVVDDGSSDATAEVAEGYARRDSRFRVYRQANGGVSAARNAGIALARAPWLFFLDADDWIVPSAFTLLLDAVSGDGIDAAYGGYVRVDAGGRETRERRPPHAEDLFPVFTQMCAFAIHACLNRTELIRAAGGFDEALVTCEDWDLWQRVARTGARFAAIPDYIAYYRMRPESASANGARMLADGLEVIARGHAEDTRLTGLTSPHRPGAPGSARPLARLYFACYAAGLVIAGGEDARWMVASLGDERPPAVDPGGVAETLFYAIPNGRAAAPEEWPEFPPEVLGRCREFVDALAEWTQDRWLSFGAQRALERLALGAAGGSKPRTAGSWHLTELDCLGAPPSHLVVEPAVEHLLCSVKVGDRELGAVELPAVAGWVAPRVLADGIAAESAWEILRAHFTQHVYPALTIVRTGTSAQVERDGVPLAEAEVPPLSDFEEWLHDQVGWTVLLQELWGRPSWTGERFYSVEPEPAPHPHLAVGEEPPGIELIEPLPTLTCDGDSAAIGLTLAGVPLMTLRLPAQEGRVEPGEIRRAALTRLGFSLCCEVVRELILAPAQAATMPLGEVLRAAAAERAERAEPTSTWADGSQPRPLVPGWHRALPELLPPGRGATVIGRRAAGAEGTAASRYAIVPAGAREALTAAALGGGDPVLEIAAPEPPACIAYAPCLQWDRTSPTPAPGVAGRPRRGSLIAGLRRRFRPRHRDAAAASDDGTAAAVAAPRLPILMYHRVAASGQARTARWRIDPGEFERQLELLREGGYYSVSFEQWRTALGSRQPPPGKPIVLTFDDGYVDFLEQAAPLLKRYGFSATVFVVAELVGRSNEWDADLGERLPLMGWEEIERLARDGFEIGSHSARHLPLVTLDQGRLATDLARSKSLLEERLGTPVTSLSYPFGLHDATVQSVAGACGYEFAVTTDEWPASWSDSLLALPRLEVHGDREIEDFVTLLNS
ncbi:MAG TPA: glycosyltransferase [Solirubrobacterales bacterium]|nr:glycosyltransferase [Solirubrobacterales bacterium]